MFKQVLYSLLFTALVVSIVSCGSGGRKKTDAGFEYEFFTKNDGKKPQNGDMVTLQLMLFGKSKGKDTLLQSTYQNPQPADIPYKTEQADFLTKGLAMVSEGDSFALYIPVDSLLRGNPLPPFIDPKSEARFSIKIIKIQSNDEYTKNMQKRMEEMQKEADKKTETQKPIDEELIKKYVADNKLDAKRTESGLYYVITTEGKGVNPKQGEQVATHYTGYLLSGEKFDSSLDRGQTLDFVHNAGQMIKGFDEGVALLKKGGKAILLIPSHLGYGAQGAANGQIPPYAVLKFDVELVDIKAATTPTPQQ